MLYFRFNWLCSLGASPEGCVCSYRRACLRSVACFPQIHNDDGVWLRLNDDTVKQYVPNMNGYTEAWCLSFNQHLGRSLLLPVDVSKVLALSGLAGIHCLFGMGKCMCITFDCVIRASFQQGDESMYLNLALCKVNQRYQVTHSQMSTNMLCQKPAKASEICRCMLLLCSFVRARSPRHKDVKWVHVTNSCILFCRAA